MSRSRIVYCLLCFVLLFAISSGLVGDRVALATQEGINDSFSLPPNQEQPEPEERLELTCTYPVLTDISGKSFEFEVGLRWLGEGFKSFELAATAPPGWRVEIVGGYPEKEIPAIELEPGQTYPEKIKVRLAPPLMELPEPGDYVVTLEVSSGNIKEAIELKAVVTALYRFAFYTATGRLNTEVTAGEENHLSVMVANTGTATIEDVTLLSTKPQGWTITFNPSDVESLEPDLAQEVDVVITPPSKTVAGD